MDLSFVSALIIAGAIVWGARRIHGVVQAAREQARQQRLLEMLTLLAPALAVAQNDPLALLAWQPVVRTARALFPEECAALDRAAGAVFPFSPELIQDAHARWTAQWLAWERTHDTEYKLKAAAVEEELANSGGSPLVRARLDAVEREKLETYQRRYEEYIRVGKALQGLMTS